MSAHSWAIIANPTAGRSLARGSAELLARAVERGGASAEVSMTAGPGNAEELARKAVGSGATRVVACGGDGTVHEVVNGIKSADRDSSGVAFGVLSLRQVQRLQLRAGPSERLQEGRRTIWSAVRSVS